MPSYLAPLITALVLSAALYQTKDVWSLQQYNMQKAGWSPHVIRDVHELQAAVQRGEIAPDAAQAILGAKWQSFQGGQKISDAQYQQMASYAAHQTQASRN